MNTSKTPNIPEAKEKTKNTPNTSLLRIGVIFLALVSFFTTANGMKTYIFHEDASIAYAASAAIQSILLALSMNLPKYLQGVWRAGKVNEEKDSASRSQSENSEKRNEPHSTERWKYWGTCFIRLSLCCIIIVLTGVTIFCSSWFSYVYIADVIHKDSWDSDSELLVQQTYRAELYDAKDYAHSYRTYLEERVGEDILLLEQQAQSVGDSVADVDVDWDAETNAYVSNGGAAAGYMSSVIPLMEAAMKSDASQEQRDMAAIAIANAKDNISSRIETIQTNLDRINASLANYNTQIANLTNRINNATSATDIASLNNAINSLTQQINSSTQQQIDLQQESLELDRALMRLPNYESLLGLNNSTSSISIRSRLLEMQTEFFKADPDDQRLQETAVRIFEDLRDAASTVSQTGDDTTANDFSYTNLLVQMNRLILNLSDYSEMKDIEENLDHLIDDLRSAYGNDSIPNQNHPEADSNTGADNTAGQPSGADGQTEVPPETTDPNAAPGNEGEQEPGQNVPDGSSADSESSQDTQPTEAGNTRPASRTWQEEWRVRLEALKAQISAMPVYNDSEGTETDSILTDSQRNVLRDYDRNAASAELDEMIRRYISEHNAIYQGLIYLDSPYKMLAVFALCLAFAFDLSGFVFGFVMQGESQGSQGKDVQSKDGSHSFSLFSSSSGRSKKGAEWSILEHLNQYRVLTGDFSRRNDVYYYKVFNDGLEEQWKVKVSDSAVPYSQGIYILKDGEAGAAQNIDEVSFRSSSDGAASDAQTEQELSYAGQVNGPRDGIYLNCILHYQEGGLSKQTKDKKISFICSLDEYVPVHCYCPAEKENRTFPVKHLAEMKKLKARTAVVALNKSGTSVSAIYLIKSDKNDIENAF